MQCEKYTQAAFMTLSPDNIFRMRIFMKGDHSITSIEIG